VAGFESSESWLEDPPWDQAGIFRDIMRTFPGIFNGDTMGVALW